MRRRDRTKDSIWLKYLPGDPAVGRALRCPEVLWGTAEGLGVLTGGMSLFVEIEQRDGHYGLRCFPSPSATNAGRPHVAATYTGKVLTHLISSAVRDYEIYMADSELCLLSPREVIRWVV